MFCAQITFWQYFKNVKQGGCLASPMSLKYCKNVIGAQNMLTYFRLHYLHICQGVDALKANPLKKALLEFAGHKKPVKPASQ